MQKTGIRRFSETPTKSESRETVIDRQIQRATHERLPYPEKSPKRGCPTQKDQERLSYPERSRERPTRGAVMGWPQALTAAALLVSTIGWQFQTMRIPDGTFPFFSGTAQQADEEDRARCFPALFGFGSSVADTGAQATALPYVRTQFPPYGSTFFGRPALRSSDGRLHIDFWALALKIPFLDPYLKGVGANFRRGANFAAAGSTATNDTAVSPFPLFTQLNQFREFKRSVVALGSKDSEKKKQLPTEADFRNGLYVMAIGGNDLLKLSVSQRLPPADVKLLVPKASQAILQVVEALYAEGARNILVEDVYPQGCVPLFLDLFAREYADQLDGAGCVKPFNDIVQLHRDLLVQGVGELRQRLPDIKVAVVDTFSKRYEIIANYKNYGLEVPLKACCGNGGDYNFNINLVCGDSKVIEGQVVTAGMCDNVSIHAMWDGIHFTDTFNRAAMKGILAGKHFLPDFDLIRNGCTLGEI